MCIELKSRFLVLLFASIASVTLVEANEAVAALWKGDTNNAMRLLTSDPALINKPGESECTPLHHAARFNHTEIVRWLITNKAEVNARAYNRFTPLHLTTNKEIARLLIQNGADLDAKDSWGKTPLQNATQQTNYYAGAIEAIIESGKPIDLKSALWLGKRDLVKTLVLRNPKLLQPDDREADLHANTTPLGIAALLGEKELVELFLKKGAPVNGMTDRPSAGVISPLQNAVMARKPEIAEILCKAGADVNSVGGKFVTGHYVFLLDYARRHSTTQIVEILQRHGAKAAPNSVTPRN